MSVASELQAKTGLDAAGGVAARIDPRLVLAGITVLAFVVRAMAMGSRLHVDDAYSWLVASQPNPHAFLRQLAATENTPPLSYLLLTPLPINDPAWLRLPAVLFGTLMTPAVYAVSRRPFGAGAALLAALAVAVAPFLITYSNLARGFMLEDAALLVVLAAALRLVEAWSSRWAAVYVLGAIAALYTEYSSVVFLLALTTSLLWVGRPARRSTVALLGLALLALAPWLPEIIRAENQVGVTKLHPLFATPSLTAVRDAAVTLTLGEHGGTSGAAGRWAEFVVIVVAAGSAAVLIRRRRAGVSPGGRVALRVIAATTGLTLVGHALAPVVGVDVFSQRYMTILIPLTAILGALALSAANLRTVTVLAAVALTALGVAEAVRRYRGEYVPSFTPVRTFALSVHPRTVLTNNPLVLYYLRDLHPVFDRPADLGIGLAGSCAHPCLIIDFAEGSGGTPRRAAGPQRLIPPYLITVER